MPATLVIFLVSVGITLAVYPGFRYEIHMKDGEKVEVRFFDPQDTAWRIAPEIAKNTLKDYSIRDVYFVLYNSKKKKGKLFWASPNFLRKNNTVIVVQRE